MSENKLDIKALIAKANEFELDDINNIDWENMGSWPVLGKVVFCVLLFALVLTGGYFYVISDEIDVYLFFLLICLWPPRRQFPLNRRRHKLCRNHLLSSE